MLRVPRASAGAPRPPSAWTSRTAAGRSRAAGSAWRRSRGRTSQPSGRGVRAGRGPGRVRRAHGRARGTSIRSPGGDAGVVGDPAVVVDDAAAAPRSCDHRLGRAAQPVEPPRGAATERASASRTAVSTSAPIAGCRVSAGPLTSTIAEQLAGARVVDRGGGAVPGVLGLLVVLGGEQLYRSGLGQRGADRVGADHRSVQHRALEEAEPVGGQRTRGEPSRQSTTPSASRHDHQEERGVGDAGQHPAQLVDDQREPRRAPSPLDLVDAQRATRVGAVGVRPIPRRGPTNGPPGRADGREAGCR